MANENAVTVNRTFKSTVFIMLFEDKNNLLELYNAMTGKGYLRNFSARNLSHLGVPIETIASAVESDIEEVQERLACAPDKN